MQKDTQSSISLRLAGEQEDYLQRLSNLCGSLDGNLREVERHLAIRIIRRGENFRLSGDRDDVSLAVSCLRHLYECADNYVNSRIILATVQECRMKMAMDHSALISEASQERALSGGGNAHTRGRNHSKDSKALRKGEQKMRGKDKNKSARMQKEKAAGSANLDDALEVVDLPLASDNVALQAGRKIVRPRSVRQMHYLNCITHNDLVFGIGPAGTGKTFLAVAAAVSSLEQAMVQRIIVTRPALEAGEKLGFLPGNLAEKFDPYLRPVYDALYDMLGADQCQRYIERNIIEIAPLAFMRGRTLNEAFVILDEAQNTTPEQMKMLLTRIGYGTRTVVNGDLTQTDLPVGQNSGLNEASAILKKIDGVAIVNFDSADVVRNPLVARIISAYDAKL